MYQPLGNSDNDIVKKIQDGNKEYFEILVTRYKAKISGFIYRFGCKEDVEDLLQEVFLKAYKNLKSFDPNWKFQTWLYMIAQQLCCNFLDAQRLRRHKNIEEVPAPIAPGIDPKTRTIQIERDVKLQQAMNEMPLIYKKVYILIEAEDLSYKETAEILSLTIPKVKGRLHNARKWIIEWFRENYPEIFN